MVRYDRTQYTQKGPVLLKSFKNPSLDGIETKYLRTIFI